MTSHTTRQFRELLQRLPSETANQARRAFRWFAQDPHHDSLSFKQVKPGIWSARVGIHHRALAIREGDDVVWFWIGSHADYDQLLRRR
jgi:hypothetical protein